MKAWKCSGPISTRLTPRRPTSSSSPPTSCPHHASAPMPGISHQDQESADARSSRWPRNSGKPVHPLIVPTDDPFAALARIAKAVNARERS